MPATGTAQPPPSGPPPTPGGAFGALLPLLMVAPLFLIMWYMNRNQQKRQKEVEDRLKVGDRILTQSGLIGKLVEKGDKYIKVEIAPGIKVQMLRSTIVGLDGAEEAPKSQQQPSK